MDIIINQHCWRFVTSSDAVGELKGESFVRGGLTRLNAELIFHCPNDHPGMLQEAGKAFTDSDDISSKRLGRDKGIESGHTIDFT